MKAGVFPSANSASPASHEIDHLSAKKRDEPPPPDAKHGLALTGRNRPDPTISRGHLTVIHCVPLRSATAVDRKEDSNGQTRSSDAACAADFLDARRSGSEHRLFYEQESSRPFDPAS